MYGALIASNSFVSGQITSRSNELGEITVQKADVRASHIRQRQNVGGGSRLVIIDLGPARDLEDLEVRPASRAARDRDRVISIIALKTR